MAWTRADPGAGDIAAIGRVAEANRSTAETLLSRVFGGVKSAISEADSAGWVGESATAFVETAGALLPEVMMIVTGLDADAQALILYANAVDQIKSDARILRYQEDDLEAKIRHDTVPRPYDFDVMNHSGAAERERIHHRVDQNTLALHRVRAGWDELELRRRAADAACSLALSSPASRGSLAGFNENVSGLSGQSLLDRLTGLSAVDLAIVLGEHPQLGAQLAKENNPDAVAKWWKSYSNSADPLKPTAAQLALIAAVPSALGNLGGVAYWARDKANRLSLNRETARLAKYARQTREDIEFFYRHGNPDAAGAFQITPEWKELLANEATQRTLASAKGDPVYQLIQYQPGDPTLAAISVGNMDTASQITTDVPGMDTSVGGSIEAWTGDAGNLYSQQSSLINKLPQSQESGVAVVAWIGYEPPAAPPASLGVVSSDKARAGGILLADFLESTTATRGWSPGQNLSVVAHSYGTTTAAFALEKTPVENFTMLASAGLDRTIGNVSHLKVQSTHVFASEAAGDSVADWGRGPQATSAGALVWQHPVNPTDQSFGARTFSSDASNTQQAGRLFGSDGHDASPQVSAGLDGTTTTKHGYLDRNTTPIYNAALTSLGLADSGALITQ